MAGHDLLVGRTAVVTGAGQGLGEAIALEFAVEGATVAVVERDPKTCAAVTDRIRANGGQALGFALDITDYGAFELALAAIAEGSGSIDVIVNNAAICEPASLMDTSLESWRRQIAVDLEAVFMGTKLAVPHLRASGRGRVINISSINAFVSSGRWPAYDAAKGGIAALTKASAVELAEDGILVNAIAPGFMRTPMSVVDGVDETETPPFLEWFIRRRIIPIARPGTPEDVAGLAVFLASDYCRYLTGEMIVIDGGMTSRTWFREDA